MLLTLIALLSAAGLFLGMLHAVAFAAMMSLAVYVIIDLEYPRLGLIRVDKADQMLIDLRHGMN